MATGFGLCLWLVSSKAGHPWQQVIDKLARTWSLVPHKAHITLATHLSPGRSFDIPTEGVRVRGSWPLRVNCSTVPGWPQPFYSLEMPVTIEGLSGVEVEDAHCSLAYRMGSSFAPGEIWKARNILVGFEGWQSCEEMRVCRAVVESPDVADWVEVE